MTANPFLLPIFSLIAWTLLVWIWMYATRIPAIVKAKMPMDSDAPRGSQMSQLPANVRWKADNYDHLLEQPTLFYAAALALAVFKIDSAFAVQCAWAYVALRIVHTLVQTLGNNILWRFGIFVLSTLPLFGMTFVGLTHLI